MIIGLFNDSYPPVVDGVARVVLNYARELEARGDTCYVITPEIPGTEDIYRHNLLTFSSFPAPGRKEYRFGLGTADIPFWNKVKDIPFDILHSHSPFSAHLVASALAKRTGTPLVSTFHSKYRDDFCQVVKNEKLVDAVVVKGIVRTYDRVDEVWTVNGASSETLRGYGYNGHIHVMENGCDIEPAEPDPAISAEIRARFGLSDAPILMYIGQHTVQKNLPMLVDALERLHAAGKDFNMLFIGDGALRTELMDRVRQNGLDRKIVFTGIIRDRELIKKIYLSSYALVFPSLYDTSSLVPREAAACVCPTIFVEGSSTAEGIVHQQNGFLAPGAAPAFAESLAALLSAPALRDTVARCARETLYRSWTDAVDTAYHRYEELIACKQQTGSERHEVKIHSSRRWNHRSYDRGAYRKRYR
jgi:glycosyltransferase involved in cell wall biosynthesis